MYVYLGRIAWISIAFKVEENVWDQETGYYYDVLYAESSAVHSALCARGQEDPQSRCNALASGSIPRDLCRTQQTAVAVEREICEREIREGSSTVETEIENERMRERERENSSTIVMQQKRIDYIHADHHISPFVYTSVCLYVCLSVYRLSEIPPSNSFERFSTQQNRKLACSFPEWFRSTRNNLTKRQRLSFPRNSKKKWDRYLPRRRKVSERWRWALPFGEAINLKIDGGNLVYSGNLLCPFSHFPFFYLLFLSLNHSFYSRLWNGWCTGNESARCSRAEQAKSSGFSRERPLPLSPLAERKETVKRNLRSRQSRQTSTISESLVKSAEAPRLSHAGATKKNPDVSRDLWTFVSYTRVNN